MLFSSALERIFFRMPSKATMLVSLPMGKQVSPRVREKCSLQRCCVLAGGSFHSSCDIV